MSHSRPNHQSVHQAGEQLESVVAHMIEHSLVLTTAESCTAGLIAASLADVPGAGKVLESAFVVYSPEANQKRLGVNAKTIERFNLTSEEVAREMATGAMRNSDANLAISNTGVTDATDPDIESGTQCFAWCFARRGNLPETLFSETKKFAGDRKAIRDQAALYALSKIPALHARIVQALAPQEQKRQEGQVAHENQ